MLRRVNHCKNGYYHMLDKIAYDYVTALRKRGANVAKIKHELAEQVKKYSAEEKAKFRELIQKWLENINISLRQTSKKTGRNGATFGVVVIKK